MRDNELRGIILEALYNQRRWDFVDFEAELGKLPLPDGAMESIVRELEKKGLIERPFRLVTDGNVRVKGARLPKTVAPFFSFHRGPGTPHSRETAPAPTMDRPLIYFVALGYCED